jgi:hypothetical protein
MNSDQALSKAKRIVTHSIFAEEQILYNRNRDEKEPLWADLLVSA